MKNIFAIGIFAASALATNLCAQQKQRAGIKSGKTPAVTDKTPTKTSPKATVSPARKAGTKAKTGIKNPVKEHTAARAVRDFLEWYQRNIGEKNPAKLGARLKSSGLVGPKFSIASGAGADGYDPVLQIEDAAPMLQNPAGIEIIPVTDLDGKALVKVIFPDAQDVDVRLVKIGQKWLIEDIRGK